MRKSKGQLSVRPGKPTESFHWGHLMYVLWHWQDQLWHRHVKAIEPTLAEIASIETRVRKELYP